MYFTFKVFKAYPSLLSFFKHDELKTLVVADLLQLFTSSYSENGSNSIRFEKNCFSVFVKYLREVAAGRRTCGEKKLDLGTILKFVTGTPEVPPLGFSINPKITFGIPQEPLVNGHKKPNFTPSAHTCSNELTLPRGTHVWNLPEENVLFPLYDLAFTQDYFGVR